MNISAAIAETEVRTRCGILSSLHDHAKGAQPRQRGGDAPGRGRPGVQAGGFALRSVNILFQVRLPLVAGSALKLASPTPTRGQPPCRIPTKGAHPLRNFLAGCYPASRLRAPVSRGDCAISRRTVMNNAD